LEQQKHNTSFFGISSFAKVPIVDVDGVWEANAAVFGVPFDASAGYRPGARFGPRSIRDLSTRLCFFESSLLKKGYWDIDLKKRFLENAVLVDCGDVDVISVNSEYTFKETVKIVEKIIKKGAIPVALGGDHSISIPCIEGFKNQGPLDIVHLDAHLDLRDSLLGAKHGHSSVIRRAMEMEHVEKVASVGIRGLRTSEDDYYWAKEQGNQIISYGEFKQAGLESVLASLDYMKNNCYVTIDIDVLNVSEAPGTGTPEAEGLTYTELKKLLQGLASTKKIVGFDLVEVNPLFDPTGITSLAASRLIIEFLGAIIK